MLSRNQSYPANQNIPRLEQNLALANKFKNIEEYLKLPEIGYQLLPFNFHRLPDATYICVNMVGEFVCLKKNELNSLVNQDIQPTNPLYDTLKSKHIIMDQDSNVALDLLALKYRTKQNRVSQFTSLHMFVVTLRCDYTCKYCQVSRQTEDIEAFDMSEDTAIAALKLMFMSPSKSLKIEFQGGEPLLNFKLIKYIVTSALELNLTEKREIQFVITSNLSFLDQEILKFCFDHDIYFSTSLDGQEELHNKNRPRPNKDGYKKTIEGIRKIQNYLGPQKVSALMTTTADSLYEPKKIIDEYVSLGLHSVFLRPISPYGFAIKTKQVEKYNIDKWMEFYISGLEYIIELNRSGYFLTEQYAVIILNKIFNPSNPGYVDLQSPAGIGISAVTYNYDGDIYASDEARMLKEMGDETFKLGNAHKNNYSEIFGAEILFDSIEQSIPESAPMCSECGLITYCGADPVYHYATQGDVVGKKPISFFCKKNTSIIEHIFQLLQNKDTRSILEGWLN